MRDYRAADTIRVPFSTNAADGSAATPTAASAKVYEDGSLVEITAGVTVATAYDGTAGANMVVIDGAAAGLKPGKTYSVQVTATVAGLSCVAWVGQFSVLAQGGDIVSRGQLDAGGAGAFTLPAGQRARVKIGDAIRIVSGTGAGYRPILTYNSTTGAGTVSAWDVNPVAGDYYEVVSLPNPEVLASTDFADSFLTANKIADNAITANKIAGGAITASKFSPNAVDASALAADAVTEIQTGLATAAALAAVQADTDNLQTRLPAALVGGKMDAVATVDTTGLATAAQATDIQGRLPAALVGGRISASVDNVGLADGAITASKLAAAAITAAKFATDAIDANALKADAVAKIQANLATLANQATIASYIDTEIANIQSRLPAALVGGKMDAVAVAAVDNAAIAAAIFAYLVESGLPFLDFCRLTGAVLLGKSTGIEGLATTFSSADVAGGVVVGSKTRVTATREADADRLTVTVDAT